MVKKATTPPLRRRPTTRTASSFDQPQPPNMNYSYPYRQRPSAFGNGLLILLLVALSFFAGYLFAKVRGLEKGAVTTTAPSQQQAAGAQPTPVQVSLAQVKKLFTNDYMHFGDANNKVLFVEISDPSCPYCHVADGLDSAAIPGDQFKYVSEGGTYTPPLPEMRKLVDEGKASYVMIYSTGHGNGRLGAEALYCAHEKGKFWEVHDLLMTQDGYDLLNNTVKNDRNSSDQLAQFLSSAIDSDFMSSCLKGAKYEKRLTRDEQLSPSLGFQGTPTFLVNTTVFSGAYDYKQMESAVTAALK